MKAATLDISTLVTTTMRTMTFRTRSNRGVAQPGSAPEWGSGGRRFKSSHPEAILGYLLVSLVASADILPTFSALVAASKSSKR